MSVAGAVKNRAPRLLDGRSRSGGPWSAAGQSQARARSENARIGSMAANDQSLNLLDVMMGRFHVEERKRGFKA